MLCHATWKTVLCPNITKHIISTNLSTVKKKDSFDWQGYIETSAAFLLLVLLLFIQPVNAQDKQNKSDLSQINPGPFSDNSGHWYSISEKDRMINPLPNKPKYNPTDIAAIGDNIILFQKTNGGWAKNYDVFAILTNEQKDSVHARKDELNTTFDNGTCYTQIAALAIVYTATKDDKYKESALRGIDYLLSAQYKENGGWPQFYPLESDYSKCITYNDGAMIGVMNLLKDILDRKPQYAFIDEKRMKNIEAAYAKGLDCIIKTQINDAAKPTAWCQQYNEVTLQPAWARKFEPPSICNAESSEIVLFLMSIKHPSKEVIDAVQNAVSWFKESRILNTRIEKISAPSMVTPFRVSTSDRVVVVDSSAPPIWTRYYELKTHRPMFCNRDSKIVYSLSEVARERRDGYSWYNYSPEKVFKKYPKWQQLWVPDNNVLTK